MKQMIDALFDFIGKNPEASFFYNLTLQNFFGETAEAYDCQTTDALMERVGEPTAHIVISCFYSYFFSVDVQPDEDDTPWNVIDAFLAQNNKLTDSELAYLRSFRQSFISIHEVVDFSLGQSVTVRDLILGSAPQVVSENRLTYQISKGDILGLRIVEEDGRPTFAGDTVPLPKKAGKELALMLKTLTSACLAEVRQEQRSAPARGRKKAPIIPDAEIQHMIRCIWSKKIAAFLMEEQLQKSTDARPLLNASGHPLESCTLTFQIPKGEHHNLGNRLMKLRDLHVSSTDKTILRLDWLKAQKGEAMLPKDSKLPDDALIVDTFTDSEHGKRYLCLGGIEVRPGRIVATANSRQRALLLEEKICACLQFEMGKHAVWKTHKPQIPVGLSASADAKPKSKRPLNAKEQKMLDQHLRQHYKEWLDMPIPALDNKTPRQMVRTPAGKTRVTQLLTQICLNARTQDLPLPLDLSFLWKELGLEKPAFLDEPLP